MPSYSDFCREIVDSGSYSLRVATPTGGRDILSLLRVLLVQRRNVLVVGDRGSGKSAFVRDLAKNRLAVAREHPDLAYNLIALDWGELRAFAGNAEQAVVDLLRMLKQNPHIILVLDGLAPVLESRLSDSAAAVAARLIENSLSHGDICCIGTLRPEQYQRSVAEEPRWQGRFEVVQLGHRENGRSAEREGEGEDEASVLYELAGMRAPMAERYDTTISDSALGTAAGIARLYLKERPWLVGAVQALEAGCERHQRKRKARADLPPALLDQGSMRYLTPQVSARDVIKAVSEAIQLDILVEAGRWKGAFRQEVARVVRRADPAWIDRAANTVTNLKMGARSPFGLGAVLFTCSSDANAAPAVGDLLQRGFGSAERADTIALGGLEGADSMLVEEELLAQLRARVARMNSAKPRVVCIAGFSGARDVAKEGLLLAVQSISPPPKGARISPFRNILLLIHHEVSPKAGVHPSLAAGEVAGSVGEGLARFLGPPTLIAT